MRNPPRQAVALYAGAAALILSCTVSCILGAQNMFCQDQNLEISKCEAEEWGDQSCMRTLRQVSRGQFDACLTPARKAEVVNNRLYPLQKGIFYGD